jgi:DNA adenine methylase
MEEEGMRKIGFGYMGGKFSHLGFLLKLLPYLITYVELFGGCAAAMLNRKISPIEIYNDLNGDLYNFFKVLRDKGDELIRVLELTTFSRREFEEAIKEDTERSDVERARCFFVLLLQVRLCSPTDPYLTKNRWNFATSRKGNNRDGVRAGKAIGVSRFLNKIDMLPEIITRLRDIQIENIPATKAIDLYDSPQTLFYADPPYVHAARAKDKIYKYEMSDREHRELAWKLNNIKGLAAVSGYQCDLYEELYEGWYVHKERVKKTNYNKQSVGGSRQEVLWTNYDINNIDSDLVCSPWSCRQEIQGQMKFSI